MSYKQSPLLEFKNPIFHDGVNITVRHGDKWNGVRQARIQLGGGHVSNRVDLHTRLIKFSDLTDSELHFEHDPSCRTVAGLAEELKRVYPEFTEESMVTVVTFLLAYRIPKIGDDVFTMEMGPIHMGKVDDVVELNDNFYEIHYGLRTPKIVHPSQYITEFWEQDGWFI